MDKRLIHFRLDTAYRYIGSGNGNKVVIVPAFSGHAWFVKYQEIDKSPYSFAERISIITLRDFLLKSGFDLINIQWDKEPTKLYGYNPFMQVDVLYNNIESNVYFAHNPINNLIKIGYSKHVKMRLNNLRSEHKAKIAVLGLLQGSRMEEAKLHETFSSQRETGEWFRECPEILEFIKEYCYMPRSLTEPKKIGRKISKTRQKST